MQKTTYKVQGMHCGSCELLIEEKLIALPGVKQAKASTPKGEVELIGESNLPSEKQVNDILKEMGYSCQIGGNPPEPESNNQEKITSIAIAGLVFAIFLLLNQLGFSSLVNVSSSSALPAFFLFGLLAGFSTCAALTGGIVLSMSQSWQGKSMTPHLLFNLGRLGAYGVLGALLGIVGNQLQMSPLFNALLVIGVSVFMILNGLKMFGVKALSGFQIGLPKSLTKNAMNQRMPLIMGALTILLPCGFTITTESLALISKNPVQGALIMALFALGTAPGLLAIGYSSVKMGNSSNAVVFSKVAGALVLMFALFNINNQLNVLGVTVPAGININTGANGQVQSTAAVEGLAPVVNGKQLLKMNASSTGYTPNKFVVKAGVPVHWEITDTGTSGCTNAIISNSLFEGSIPLTNGQVSVKEFTPTKAGKFRFSCWMGMVSGVIEVVDVSGNSGSSGKSGTSANNVAAAAAEIPSGAKGCGCGGGGGSSCGGSR